MILALLLLTLGTDWTAVIKPASRQVPRIEILRTGETKPGICSGVVLNADQGFVLTAAHCTGTIKDRDITSMTVNGRHAELARVNELLDLAVVRFSPKDELTMPLATVTPGAGSEIAVIGFLLGSKQLHTQFGHIAARRDEDGAVVLDSQVLPGDSGGSIINPAGELVAMTNRYYTGTAIGLAVPVETIRDFVEPYLPAARIAP